jgi:hypothetical protein
MISALNFGGEIREHPMSPPASTFFFEIISVRLSHTSINFD